ncbi:alpha/beta fold hydrolase [Bailinhaonella thermotolerans]|uniref:Alpha/beta fold hydrolase n=1 Tax=Bailinhaonella thermotolerans TaxID=1070861 RepID=A0A3A4B6R3_9ACTN|nr:alpha/beta fold hydrolase [Bailinhaonella thermotolerans]RJL33204.1 alpha/beta fold hydrolase [Bailinhaonella thermotolerans]
MRITRLAAGGLLTAALAGSTISGGTAAAETTRTTTQEKAPRWETCAGPGLPADMRCATVRVPVDWARPGGPAIDLRVARLAATGPRIGSVLLVPGGPGKSSVQDLAQSGRHFAGLRQRFDLVAFDPRHHYERLAALAPECSRPGVALVTDPRDPQAYGRQARALADAMDRCRRADGTGLVDHLDAVSVARDMEAIRAVLGEERLSLMAESYGGFPAAAYARLHPGRIRAMYLDGTPDHTVSLTELSRLGTEPLERVFGRFAAWCAEDPACALRGQDVRGVWRRLLRDADRRPIPFTGKGPFGEVRGEMSGMHLAFAAPLLLAQEDQGRWRDLAAAIDRARRGDVSGFADLVAGNSQVWTRPAGIAAQCPNYGTGGGYRALARERRELGRDLPDLGRSAAWLRTVCSGRPDPANPPGPIPARELPPLLGAGSRTDHGMTAALVGNVPGSATVRYDAPGHSLYLSGVRCVIAHADRYLTDLRLPPKGTVCPKE